MSFLNITFIAAALAMDAFAVAVAAGVTLKTLNPGQRFRLSFHFGLFQALMPVIGWFAGTTVSKYIEQFDHWIAFGLLTYVAFHMIKEFFAKNEIEQKVKDPTKGMMMVLLSISTSIDALAVGLSMSMLQVEIIQPAIIIGITAAVFTLIGMELGSKIGKFNRLSPYALLTGGIILLIIGFNILYEHGVFEFV